MVSFCSEPQLDGSDKCARCSSGYALHHDDGQCYFEHWTAIIALAIVCAVLLTVVIVWVVDLCCRESINGEAVTRAEAWRSRSKILMPLAEADPRHVYDINTNLCNNPIAGPGMLLHFRFQRFFIIWPFCVALVWVALACLHNELFILGTRKFGTPRHNCILVAWGYETQQRLMWTKVLFLAIVYVCSFVAFLLFSVSQLRTHQRLDAQHKTMKNFAVELTGLPELPGFKADIEKDLKQAVQNAFPQLNVVGVAVAWNYSEDQENIEYACSKDLIDKEIELGDEDEPSNQDPTANMGAVHTWMYNQEKSILGPNEKPLGQNEDQAIKTLLEKMVSSDSAFVVFKTSGDKESALAAGTRVNFDATKYGTRFKVEELQMVDITNEPANVNWHNFGDTSDIAMLRKFLKGFFTVYVPALLVWFFGFYVPYAYSLYYFNYDNGAELPGYYSFIFTIVVCGGNATMYVVCDVCCDICGFRYKDTKQVTYMLMYLCACMINVFLDMIVTYYTAMKIMVGQDFRTYHGKRLADIDAFTEQFETYAMQRSLGENVYRYAWPSTFFLCFVLEPFVTILIPYLIGRAVIRTHSEIQGACAEAYLAAFEFDLGRYADILLNVFLGILIFFFPGGYIWTLFFFMAFSHSFIYCFDHWRVINVIPCVKIVSPMVDWWAQVTMCFCCAVILSCLVFKANCESYTNYCMQEVPLLSACTIAGAAHFVVHLLLLIYLVPKLGLESKDLQGDDDKRTYETVAQTEARTWFSSNPVHCLRSKYIHKHQPYCRYAHWGKEHLLEVNEDIGCYFHSEKAFEEDFHQDIRKSMKGLSEDLKKLSGGA